MNKFNPGDLVVGVNFTYFTDRNGMEAVVTGTIEYTVWTSIRTGEVAGPDWCYPVRWADGETTVQRPHTLRRKKPPQKAREELGEWELCPWRPEKVTAS